ncbi:methyltransferase domain-containing protein [Streptomyces sp. SPB162]|uniref:class I SAM-dependent methyltransferase n=1 Tax=Streptomyces sp. SPB162 TaxID=2940560 RepID=UPI0024059D93|nr:methyltransferase domain-containing protein [Streptomyces sp. SPB162]MDF9814217.1 SAM-dependent methyltransferase [Streptomyces sp. SPB162]
MTQRARWDESAPFGAASEHDDLEDFRAGEDMVRPFEAAEMGSVTGKSLLHLQCRLGHEALAWARRGASRVVGLDSSESAVEAARDLAADLGLPPDRASFVAADVYDAAGAVPDSAYDIVYTGPGALCRLPDLVRWAETAASLVAPSGFLYLADFHPLASSLIADDFSGDGSYPDFEGWGRQHTLGDVVTAVAATGLRLDFLHEHDGTHASVPLMYSLRASHAAGS